MRTAFLISLVLLIPALVTAQYMLEVTVECATDQPVTLFSLPSGEGDSLNNARDRLTGARVDATITLTLCDDIGNPIAYFPFEDIWLESTFGGMLPCPGGTVADTDTDAFGQTWFTGPLKVGGTMDVPAGELLTPVVNGWTFPEQTLDIAVLTPDLNGDLWVGLTDTVLFVQLYQSGLYQSSIDYYSDGMMSLPDVIYYAQGINTNCP